MRSLPLECLLTMFSLALHLYFQIAFCFIVLHAECTGKNLEKREVSKLFLPVKKLVFLKFIFHSKPCSALAETHTYFPSLFGTERVNEGWSWFVSKQIIKLLSVLHLVSQYGYKLQGETNSVSTQ